MSVVRGERLTTGGNDGNILDLDRGGYFITVYISKLTEQYTKKGEFYD